MEKQTKKEIGDLFEDQVYKILEQTTHFNIEPYGGGGDRGRDIVVQYKVNGEMKKVHVECKSRKSKVNISDIRNSVDWAIAHDQDLYYIWTNNFFQINAKDHLTQTSKKYNLNIAYEEKKNIDIFSIALEKEDKQVFTNLTNKIFEYLKLDYINENIVTLYNDFKFKLQNTIYKYCSENHIECILVKESGLIIKFKNRLINISHDLNYRFNSSGSVSIFISDTIRCGDMKFPSLILEIVNKKIKLSTLSPSGNLNHEFIVYFSSIEDLTIKILFQIIGIIDRANYDKIYT